MTDRSNNPYHVFRAMWESLAHSTKQAMKDGDKKKLVVLQHTWTALQQAHQEMAEKN